MITTKGYLKKALSLLICIVLICASVVPCFAAVSLPSGITESQSEQTAKGIDVVIEKMMAQQGTTAEKMIKEMLFSDETLSQILYSLYSQMQQQMSDSQSFGLDISTKAVAAGLANYPSVAEAVAGADTWDTVKLDGVKWNVETEGGFADAVSAMLTPFNDLIYTLLCSGKYQYGIISINGSDGYLNGVISMLSAFGCTQITSNDEFKAQADADKNSMIRNIVLSVLSAVDYIAERPVVRVSEIAPNLAHYLKDGGLDNSVDKIINPLTIGIGRLDSLFKGKTMLAVLSFIQNPSQSTSSFSENIAGSINGMTSSSGFKMAELDLEALASCGTENGSKIDANIGQSFSVIFTWLIDTLKLNKEKVMTSVKESEEMKDLASVADSLFNKSTEEIFSFVVKLFTAEEGEDRDYQWTAQAFTPGTVSYTPNLGKEKYQRVVDGFDELIEEIVKENAGAKNLKSFMKETIYSPEIIDELVLGLYGQLSGGEMGEAVGMLGLASTPSQLASYLTESRFYSARNTLYNYYSFKNIGKGTIYWGFEKGDKDGFIKTLTAVLRPFEDALRMLLVGDKLEVMGAVRLCGSNGYNTAVIPLLEALGCKDSKIMSYEEFKKNSDGDGIIENLLTPIIELIDRICKKPAYTLLDMVPNLLFFVSNGSLMQCVENLISPVTSMLSELGISMKDLGLDLDEYKNKDLLDEISKSVPEMTDEVKLKAPDIKKLMNLGTAETRTSKGTYNGTPLTYTYVKSDQTAVLITVLRYAVELIKDPANASLMDGFMGGGDSSDGEVDMFAQYSSGITEQMASMTTDETIEWLYKLFFRERAVKQEKADDNYSTAIKFVPQKESHLGSIIKALVILLIVLVVLIISRKRIFRFFRIKKEDREIRKRIKEKEAQAAQTAEETQTTEQDSENNTIHQEV